MGKAKSVEKDRVLNSGRVVHLCEVLRKSNRLIMRVIVV